jgi:hypothetical protein
MDVFPSLLSREGGPKGVRGIRIEAWGSIYPALTADG